MSTSTGRSMRSPAALILEDDPTGTQCASDIRLILQPNLHNLDAIARDGVSAYVLTNTRAMSAANARLRVRETLALCRRVWGDRGLTCPAVVLRGDSTLRGHIWPEFDELESASAVRLFVPAFPLAGRVTLGGVHYLATGVGRLPMSRSEFASDPVFGYRQSGLLEFLLSGRPGARATSVPLAVVRERRGHALAEMILRVADGTVVVPDVEVDEDLEYIATAWQQASRERRIVARCGPPLAAMIAGTRAHAWIPDGRVGGRVLVVCGSHTDLARRQLAMLSTVVDCTVELDIEGIIEGRRRSCAVDDATAKVEQALFLGGCAVLAVPARRREHNSLSAAEAVMTALTGVVRRVAEGCDTLVTKGGITAAEVETRGLGVDQVDVLGSLLPGVAAWQTATPSGRPLVHAVVPGNIGSASTLIDVAIRLGARAAHGTV